MGFIGLFREKAKENLSKAGASYSPKEPFQISENLPIEKDFFNIEKVNSVKEIARAKRIEKEISLAQLIAPSTNREEKTNRETRTRNKNRPFVQNGQKVTRT